MSFIKRVIEEQGLQQYEFESYYLYLQKEYPLEFINTDDKIADKMNYEFNTIISGEDVKKFKENFLTEEEDVRLIYKNVL